MPAFGFCATIPNVRATLSIFAVLLVSACSSGDEGEAGVGGDRTGCGDPGSRSMLLDDHSCVCEPGTAWCSEAIDDFDCCPIAETDSGTGETAEPPDSPCDAEALEQIVCIDDPELPGPGTETWACNGEEWVFVPTLAQFECMAAGYQFAYGCLVAAAGVLPEYVCGYGPGSTCDATQGSVCVDEAIIDICVWGRRTVDYCQRLCADLEVWGPGFTLGDCVEADGVATCVCG